MLSRSAERYQTEIHTFVLMSNHYHLLLSTPQANLNAFMRYFQTETCKQIQRETNRINHIFGTRYKWSVLGEPSYMAYAYKYVLRNPINASLTERAENYCYSSLHSILKMKAELPLIERLDRFWDLIPRSLQERLDWLNQPTPREIEALIGKALRRSRFQFSQGNDVRKHLEFLRSTYGVERAPATFSAEK
jgi:putative transposase